MTKIILARLLIVAGAMLAASGAWAQGNPALEVMDIFDLETAADARISPDGDTIVYVRNFADVVSDERYSNIWTIGFDGSGHRALTTGNFHDGTPRWSPDGTRLAYISDHEGSAQIYVRWGDSGESRRISNLPEAPAGISWSPDGKHIAFTMLKPEAAPDIAHMPSPPEGATWKTPAHVTQSLVYRFNGAGYLTPGYHHIYVVPSDGGTEHQVSSGDHHHGGPGRPAGAISWTPDSQNIVMSVYRGPNPDMHFIETDIYAFALADGAVTQLADRQGPDANAAVSPDGQWIAFTGFDDRKQGYQVSKLSIMPAGGGDARVLSGSLDRSITSLQWSADSAAIYVSYQTEGDARLGRFELDGGFQSIAGHFGGGGMSAYGGGGPFTVAANGRYAGLFMSTDAPGEAGAGGGDTAFHALTSNNDDVLGHRSVGAVEEIWYQSSVDDRRIHGWIIKPPGFDASQKYPLIIEIHGGPFADYGPRFDLEKQLMAARGYVVLYTNPRGSTSYGEDFGNLIHHAYPGDDFFDLNSGVDAVIAQGYVDPEQLYVTGGSGGGVLTAWMIGRTQRFRAAAVHYPVIDWASFNLTTDIPGLVIDYWFPGMPWDHVDHYFKRSLLSVINEVETPTILITGEADHRTPISQAEQYFAALKLRGVDAAMVRIPDEPHGMRVHPSHLIAKMLNTLGWFERYR